MFKNPSILLLLAAIVALPFLLRRTDTASGLADGRPVLVIVTPHNEAIRYEFEHAFSKWHQQKLRQAGEDRVARHRRHDRDHAVSRQRVRVGRQGLVAAHARQAVARQRDRDGRRHDASRPTPLSSRSTRSSATPTTRRSSPPASTCSSAAASSTTATLRPGHDRPRRGSRARAQGALRRRRGDLIPEKLAGETWRTPRSSATSSPRSASATTSTACATSASPRRQRRGTTSPTRSTSARSARSTRPSRAASPKRSRTSSTSGSTTRSAPPASTTSRSPSTKRRSATTASTGHEVQARRPPPSVPPRIPGGRRTGLARRHAPRPADRRNARYFTDSASKAPIDVSMGDAAVGMAIDFYGRFQAQNSQGPRRPRPHDLSDARRGIERVVRPDQPPPRRAAPTDPRRRRSSELGSRPVHRVRPLGGRPEALVLQTRRARSAGGPEKFALRRLPIRRDFYPSTNPTLQARHVEHRKHVDRRPGRPGDRPVHARQGVRLLPPLDGSPLQRPPRPDPRSCAWTRRRAQGGLVRHQPRPTRGPAKALGTTRQAPRRRLTNQHGKSKRASRSPGDRPRHRQEVRQARVQPRMDDLLPRQLSQGKRTSQ